MCREVKFSLKLGLRPNLGLGLFAQRNLTSASDSVILCAICAHRVEILGATFNAELPIHKIYCQKVHTNSQSLFALNTKCTAVLLIIYE